MALSHLWPMFLIALLLITLLVTNLRKKRCHDVLVMSVASNGLSACLFFSTSESFQPNPMGSVPVIADLPS